VTAEAPSPAPRLGTFAGVFTPSILTILGIILFLRLGYVVGDAGLGRTLLIVLAANTVSVLTSWSLAAIATNFKVKGGGDYFLISRTLGAEFGGAIGITLFLAQSISIAFYAIGFAEGVAPLLPEGLVSERVIAAVAIAPLFALAWLGSDWATKFQYVIMLVLFAAIGVFVYGALQSFDGGTLSANWAPGGTLPFWTLFALFFPAVTGFTQGVSMSGELKDPARSLPLGTFLAVGVSVVVYFALAVLFAGAAPGQQLVADYDMMRKIAVVPALITAGICAATLSSALASFLGAPRILQALASDRLFPFLNLFAAGQSGTGNPRRAVLLSSGIALLAIALGDLNVIAPLVSMFFLISYGLLNYATFYEASSGSPSFRPRFRWYRRWVSLAGCLVCAAMMLAIDPTAGVIALAVLFAIHQYLGRTVEHARWADSSRSALFQRIRGSLYEMNETVVHDRDWRPVILAFTDDPERRERLLRFASWIEGGSGLTTAVRIVAGEGAAVRRQRDEAEQELVADLRQRKLRAFSRVVATADLRGGFQTLIQSAGVGPIRANIALFHWFDREGVAEDAPAMRAYGEYLRYALRFGCSVVVLAARAADLQGVMATAAEQRRIDIWWHGDASSRLALLLAHLVTRTDDWSGASLRVLVPAAAEAGPERMQQVRERLDEIRIRAEAVAVEGADWHALQTATAGAALVFLPVRVRPEGPCDADGKPLPTSLAGLPPLVLVNASKDIDLDAQPDEGKQADAARARDALEAAKASVEKRREAATAARAAAESLQERLSAAETGDAGDDEIAAMRTELEAAQARAQELERRVVASEAKVEQLATEVATPATRRDDDPKDADDDERTPARGT
jgi:amino acid transporter